MKVESYKSKVKEIFESHNITIDDEAYFIKVLELIKERCTLLTDFYEQGVFFYKSPATYDEASVKPKWDTAKNEFFNILTSQYQNMESWKVEAVETGFKNLATHKNIKMGELQMIFRVMLVGIKMGPGVFVIADAIGKEETIKRIQNAVAVFG